MEIKPLGELIDPVTPSTLDISQGIKWACKISDNNGKGLRCPNMIKKNSFKQEEYSIKSIYTKSIHISQNMKHICIQNVKLIYIYMVYAIHKMVKQVNIHTIL